jgi:hypothetical protein
MGNNLFATSKPKPKLSQRTIKITIPEATESLASLGLPLGHRKRRAWALPTYEVQLFSNHVHPALEGRFQSYQQNFQNYKKIMFSKR